MDIQRIQQLCIRPQHPSGQLLLITIFIYLFSCRYETGRSGWLNMITQTKNPWLLTIHWLATPHSRLLEVPRSTRNFDTQSVPCLLKNLRPRHDRELYALCAIHEPCQASIIINATFVDKTLLASKVPVSYVGSFIGDTERTIKYGECNGFASIDKADQSYNLCATHKVLSPIRRPLPFRY